jgi:hypothetical protein
MGESFFNGFATGEKLSSDWIVKSGGVSRQVKFVTEIIVCNLNKNQGLQAQSFSTEMFKASENAVFRAGN